MVVSWQVTGVRHDALAEASPLTVEVDKGANESGKYLQPEAFGRPRSAAVGYTEERERVTTSSAKTAPERPARVRAATD